MKQPSLSTFWRFLLATTLFFAVFAFWSLVETAQRLNILVFDSKPWLVLFVLLSVFTLSIFSLMFRRSQLIRLRWAGPKQAASTSPRFFSLRKCMDRNFHGPFCIQPCICCLPRLIYLTHR